MTAPDHFLGDYPAVKWRRFAACDPGRSHRQDRARYRLQWRLLFDRDEAPRRRARAGRSMSIPTICGRRGLPPRRSASTSNLPRCRSTTSAALGERFDVVLFLGVLYHLRHPLLALDLIREHVVARPLRLPVDAARRSAAKSRSTRTTRSPRRRFSNGRAFRGCLSSSTAMPATPPIGGCRTAPAPRRCCAAPVSDRGEPGGGGLRLPARRKPRLLAARSIRRRRVLERAEDMSRHDRSRDALERAQQQVALGPRARSRLGALCQHGAAGRRRDCRRGARAARGCSAASRRSTRCSSPIWRARACSTSSTSLRCTASRSTGTCGRSTSGRQSSTRSPPSAVCRSGSRRSAPRALAPRRCRNSACSAPPNC